MTNSKIADFSNQYGEMFARRSEVSEIHCPGCGEKTSIMSILFAYDSLEGVHLCEDCSSVFIIYLDDNNDYIHMLLLFNFESGNRLYKEYTEKVA